MKFSIKISALAFLIVLNLIIKAQQTQAYSDKDALYNAALELLDKKLYGSAQKKFVEYANENPNSILKSNAIFYSAACGIELFNKDSEWMMKQFIEKNSSSLKINLAYFYLAKSNFRKKKYKETLEFFGKVDIYKLDKDQLAELYFKRGYSYLQLKDDANAKAEFYEIKDIDNKYTFPANYYFSHLSYKEKKYEIALQGFTRLVGDKTFGSVVPYYITQIYFIENKFEEVVKEAPKLLADSSNIQKETEINRMIGESYFNLKDYANALSYFKKNDLKAGTSLKGNYALGYCYYMTKDFLRAIPYFEKITNAKDSLAQNSAYHLADCYIKLNDRLKAKNAFYNAYQLDFNKSITEDALFSYAKLSYELDFNPYAEAEKSFTKYLKEYPESVRKEECYSFLTNVYSSTKNFDLAIKSIEKTGKVDPILKITYQKLIYFKAVALFNNNDLENAEKEFKKSLAQNSDLKLNCLGQYWLGEISYIRRDYSTAIEFWKKFQLMEGAIQLPEFNLSNYALGYAYFQRKEKDDYVNSNISFRKFLLYKHKNKKGDENADTDFHYIIKDFDAYSEYFKAAFDYKSIDAIIRAADSYFMNRDFIQAAEFYKIAIKYKKLDVDYALYQKALCDGLNKNYQEKIIELKTIESEFTTSNYLASALNQIADTYYRNLKDEDNAILYYNKIIKSYTSSSFLNNCYAQLGNIYYGRKEDDKAFEYYDKFIKLDGKSDEAKDVLEAIKKIFESKGELEDMENYFNSVGSPLSENQIEKATYVSAFDAYYTQKNCDLAMPKWETYIKKFPNGKYISEARYSFAECLYSQSQFDNAITNYEYIISKPRSIYSEVALSKVSYLYYKDKKYEKALPMFMQLQELAETPSNISAGKFGAMRCSFNLNQFEVALNECNKVLATEKLTPQQTDEAKYIKAKSLFETARFDDAIIEFKNITKTSKNIIGAEAYYYLGKIYFIKQDYKEVEITLTKLISYQYSNDDWNTKAMALFADTYLAKNDEVDAEVILQTIIDSKSKQEYIDEAKKKLAALKTRQAEREIINKAVPASENTQMKLEFSQTKRDNDIFNDLDLEAEELKDPELTAPIQQPK